MQPHDERHAHDARDRRNVAVKSKLSFSVEGALIAFRELTSKRV